jgi:D-glutamate cyclase
MLALPVGPSEILELNAAITGESIDRLCTVEARPQGIVRGNIVPLYQAARAKQQEPLTLLAARRLTDCVVPGDTILITTGAGSWPWLPHGETDGPLGTASLARAVSLGLGGRPIIISEDRHLPAIAAACVSIGLLVTDEPTLRARTGAVHMCSFPAEDAAARLEAQRVMDRWQPRAVIAIEKPGPNRKGEFHTLQGYNRTSGTAKVQHIFELAAQRGVLTVGFADGGNEIGCGVIYDEARRIMPAGSICKCPCGDGMASVVKSDVLVFTAISNWGAYGTSACLALIKAEPSLLQEPSTERRMLEAVTATGAGDGMTGMSIPHVDGTNLQTQEAIITILHTIVVNALRTISRPF